LKRKASPAA
jgi:putative ATP-binding cassette transporter